MRRASVWALVAFLIVVGGIGTRTVPDYGVSWDEPHSSGFADFNAQEAAAVLGIVPAQDPERFAEVIDVTRTYPPAIELLHNAISYAWLWGREGSRPTVAALRDHRSGAAHFTARHFVTFGLSLLGYVAVWAVARGLGLAGFWSLAPLLLLSSAPTYWGHSQFNSKDSGFSSAFTIAMWAASLAIPSLLGMEQRRRRFAFLLVLGVTAGFAAGGRLAGGLVFVIVLAAVLWTRPGAATQPALWARFSLAGFVAVLTLVASWPSLWGDPLSRLLSAVRTAGRFPGPEPILFWGDEIRFSELPVYYAPAVLAIKLPELVVVAGAMALVAASLFHAQDDIRRARLRLLVLWIVVPVAYVSAFRVRLYDNERHLLFLVPGLTLLAVWAISAIARRFPALKALAIGLILASAIVSALSAKALHPYEYVFFNRFIGGLRGAQGEFETDYWGLSAHELLGLVPNKVQGLTIVRVCMVTAAAQIMAPGRITVVPESAQQAEYTICGTRWGQNRKWLESEELLGTASRDGVVFGTLTRSR